MLTWFAQFWRTKFKYFEGVPRITFLLREQRYFSSHLFSFTSHLGQSYVLSSELVNLSFQFFEFLPHRHTLNCVHRLFLLLLPRLGVRNITGRLFTSRLLQREKQQIITLVTKVMKLLSKGCGSYPMLISFTKRGLKRDVCPTALVSLSV